MPDLFYFFFILLIRSIISFTNQNQQNINSGTYTAWIVKKFHACEAQCIIWFSCHGKQANMSSSQNSLLLKKFEEKRGKDASSCPWLVLAYVLRSGLFCKGMFRQQNQKVVYCIFPPDINDDSLGYREVSFSKGKKRKSSRMRAVTGDIPSE